MKRPRKEHERRTTQVGRASARPAFAHRWEKEGRLKPALLSAWERTLRDLSDTRAVTETATGRSCTFGELEAGAAAFGFDAAELAGRAVVFALPNGIRWLELFLALIRAGAIAVPLDSAEPAEAQRAAATRLGAAWWEGERLVALPPARRRRDRELCLVKLTSGTTGAPRPLFFTAAQMLADARQVTATMGIGRDDVNYALIPFGHSYGLGNLTIPLLAQGVPVVCGSIALPQAIAADFERWGPTVFPTVPIVWRALAAAELPPLALASLRLAISAGAPLPPEVARDFVARFGQSIHAFYGSSETGGIAFDRTGQQTLAGGVGRALRGVRIKPLRGGRILVASGAVFTRGNRRRAGASGAWIPPDGAIVSSRGDITLTGRRGNVVKIAGRRVSLAEVVARLRATPGIRDAWVGLLPGRDVALGAVVAAERPAAELRALFQSSVAPWKTPKKWVVVPELPVTARGKPHVRELQRLLG